MPNNILLIVDGPASASAGLQFLQFLQQHNFTVKVALSETAFLLQNDLVWSLFSGSTCLRAENISLEDLRKADIVLVYPASFELLKKFNKADFLEKLQISGKKIIAALAIITTENSSSELSSWQNDFPVELIKLVMPYENELCQLGAMGSIAIAGKERFFEEMLSNLTKQDLAGKKILITAGPTVEDIDPVRFISNRSSGKMGLALAEIAARRGAEVLLVHGPINLPLPANSRIKAITVRSAEDMYQATMKEIEQVQIAVLCAAVADFTLSEPAAEKIKKGPLQSMQLTLQRTKDILESIGSLEKRPFLVGFAAESHEMALNAKQKLQSKNCDLICANDISEKGSGFAVDTNRITLFFRDGSHKELALQSKEKCAEQIFDEVLMKLVVSG